jgi:hypothetical protein
MKLEKDQLVRERNRRNLTQTEFWGRLGVSQACGSRYESGRDMPEPVEILLELVYLTSQNRATDILKEMRK